MLKWLAKHREVSVPWGPCRRPWPSTAHVALGAEGLVLFLVVYLVQQWEQHYFQVPTEQEPDFKGAPGGWGVATRGAGWFFHSQPTLDGHFAHPSLAVCFRTPPWTLLLWGQPRTQTRGCTLVWWATSWLLRLLHWLPRLPRPTFKQCSDHSPCSINCDCTWSNWNSLLS